MNNWLWVLVFVLLFLIVYENFSNYKEFFEKCVNLLSDDSLWNKTENIEFNNCYSYAFTDMSSNKTHEKPQPGEKGKYENLDHSNNEYSCSIMIKKTLSDFPDAVFLGNDPSINAIECDCSQCVEGCSNHMVFLAIDQENEDYHFYRRNTNKLWTHKPGSLPIDHYDSNNIIISNPYYSGKNFPDFNYKTNCGFFCTKTHNII
uniref:Uncharacterized protein n=1 Tax=viral metagenome TaxID=1070528 RepID=A0A6C0JVT4_9ZZZZ